MRTIAAAALALTLSLLASLLAASPASAASLDHRIAWAVQHSEVGTKASVYAWNLRSGNRVFTLRARRQMTPASTVKLLTSAAAYAQLGPNHRFTTRVALDGTQDGSTFRGDVWLIGGGDPSLSTRAFARDNFNGRGANLMVLVRALRARGIRTIRGRIRVDDDRFDDRRWVAAWRPAHRLVQSGAVGALTVNESLLGRYVGSSSSRTPDIRAGEVFRSLLRSTGVVVSARIVAGSAPEDAIEAGVVASPPLRVLVRHMNGTSDNFFAEVLLKDVGAEAFPNATHISTADGRRAARSQLHRLGVDLSGATWIDGSGLAYRNAISAQMLARVIDVGSRQPWGQRWISSLARPGHDGTLHNRMRGEPYRSRVHAKTGTLRHTSALAGVTSRASGRQLGFVVLVSGPVGTQLDVAAAHHLQDRIAMILTR